MDLKPLVQKDETLHCAKSVRIWNFSDPYFTAFTFTGKLQWKTSFCVQCGIKMTDT